MVTRDSSILEDHEYYGRSASVRVKSASNVLFLSELSFFRAQISPVPGIVTRMLNLCMILFKNSALDINQISSLKVQPDAASFNEYFTAVHADLSLVNAT